MDVYEILSYAATAVGAGGLTQFLNWRASKRTAAAEAAKAEVGVKADEIENIRKSLEVYQTIIADQNARIAELTAEVQQLRDEKAQMERDYQRQLRAMQGQISDLYRALGVKTQKAARGADGRFKKGDGDA